MEFKIGKIEFYFNLKVVNIFFYSIVLVIVINFLLDFLIMDFRFF